MTGIETLRQWLNTARRAAFLGGAGVSTASGIPDFRSAHGLYQQKKAGLSYEEMLSHGYFVRHTAEFYDFLRGVMLYPDAKPNGAHYALAQLERQGKQLLEGDRFVPTTKVCSACGAVNESIPPKARRWVCPACGAEHRRGVNAAVNIKAKGLARYQAGQVREAVQVMERLWETMPGKRGE